MVRLVNQRLGGVEAAVNEMLELVQATEEITMHSLS